jgi:hypothetical protein
LLLRISSLQTFFLSVVDEGFYIRYRKQPDIAHGKWHHWWKWMLAQDALLICFPSQASRFHDLIKGKPDPASEYDDEGGEGANDELGYGDSLAMLLASVEDDAAAAGGYAGFGAPGAGRAGMSMAEQMQSAEAASPMRIDKQGTRGTIGGKPQKRVDSPRGGYISAPNFSPMASPVSSPSRGAGPPVASFRRSGAPDDTPLRLEDIEIA